jgi:hypothetical protein
VKGPTNHMQRSIASMMNLENNCEGEMGNNVRQMAAVYSAVGPLRPKRRWKNSPKIEANLGHFPAPVSGSRQQRVRIKKSGQPHQIYPDVFVPVRSAPSQVSPAPMTHQLVGLLRSFSFR